MLLYALAVVGTMTVLLWLHIAIRAFTGKDVALKPTIALLLLCVTLVILYWIRVLTCLERSEWLCGMRLVY